MAQFVLVLASILAAVLPMLGFLGAVWWLDRYDREPVWMVALIFAWGGLIATLLSLVGNTSIHLALGWALGPEQASLITPVVVAPLIEEPTKAAVLLLLPLSRHFDNTTDGFVYGAAAGLGFGMTENFLYFSSVAAIADHDFWGGLATWGGTVAVRTFYSALMHATATSVVGAAIGFVRFRSKLLWLLVVPVGLLVAMGIHALWNGLLTLGPTSGLGDALTYADFVLFPLQFLLVFLVFQACLWDERRVLRNELEAESEAGTLPAEHVGPLSSWRSRAFGGFASPKVDRKAYVRAATKLAFRRSQARTIKGDRRAAYNDEIIRLRLEIRGILAAAD